VYYHAWPSPKTVARLVAVSSIPLTASMPSGVLLFWSVSNIFAVARTYLMRTDTARAALGIPLASQVAALTHLPKPVPLA
jgi:membrane protein insertase Oxa1/YidC/SpoIIIJ